MTPQFTDTALIAAFQMLADPTVKAAFAGTVVGTITDTDGNEWRCRVGGSKLFVWEPPEGHSDRR